MTPARPLHNVRRLADRAKHRRGEEGLGLLEVLLAFTVLLAVIVPLSVLEGTLAKQAAGTNQKVAADQVAESWLEQLGVQNPLPTIYPATINEPDTTVGGQVYHAKALLTLAPVGTGASLCVGGTPELVEADITVSWGANNANQLEESTDFNPSQQILGPSNGFLAIPINTYPGTDPSGNTQQSRVNALVVTISGAPTTVTAQPDFSGCVFAELPAGTYTVSVAQPSAGSLKGSPAAFVGPPNSPSPIGLGSFTVVAQTTTLVPAALFDEGAAVSLAPSALTAVEQGVVCTPSGTACVVAGEGPLASGTGQGLLTSGSGTSWSGPTAVPSVTRFDAASCGSSTCVEVGVAPSGGLVASVGGVTSAISTLTGVSSVQELSCTGSLTCDGLGVNGATLVPVAFDGTNWTTIGTGWPANLTDLSQVTGLTCAAANSCDAIGTPPSPAKPEFLTYNGTTWSTVAVPAADTSAKQLTCPASGTCFALGSANDVISLSGGAAASTATGITNASWLSCPTQTNCTVIGGTAASPVSTTFSGGTWSASTALPSGVGSVTGLTCPDTTACYAMGSSSAAPPAPMPIVLSGGSWTTLATLPTNTWVSGLTCPTSATCYATAVGTSGSLRVLVYQSGTGTWSRSFLSSTAGWADGTPCSYANYTGCPGPTLPIQILTGSAPTVFCGGPSPPCLSGSSNTALPSSTPWQTLYPALSGYGLWASSCAAPAEAASVTTTPGGATTVAPPMGLLSVQAVKALAKGGPVSGATVTATLTSCAGDGSLKVTLPVTGADGISTMAVPPGTYSVKVTSGALNNTVSVTVTQQASWNPTVVVIS